MRGTRRLGMRGTRRLGMPAYFSMMRLGGQRARQPELPAVLGPGCLLPVTARLPWSFPLLCLLHPSPNRPFGHAQRTFVLLRLWRAPRGGGLSSSAGVVFCDASSLLSATPRTPPDDAWCRRAGGGRDDAPVMFYVWVCAGVQPPFVALPAAAMQ